MKQLNRDELQGNDGKEGRKSLVAYDGKVYDVTESKMWRNGVHVKAHEAGRDLTRAMKAAPHGPEVMERFETVAELVEEAAEKSETVMKTPGRLTAMVLDQHPHPISVHFPIALGLSASLMMFLSLFVDNEPFQRAALYNLVLAVLATPVSIATGVLSWYYNYSGIWTHIYRMKTLLSIVLVVLFVIALTVRFVFLGEGIQSGMWYWIYWLSVVAMAPTVIGLGYYGGKITFPS